MGIVLHKPIDIKRPEGAPKSLHKYVMNLISSYLNREKKD